MGSYALRYNIQQISSITFHAQLPHTWAEGTNIFPHLHCIPEFDTEVNKSVPLKFRYQVSGVGVKYDANNTKTIYIHIYYDNTENKYKISWTGENGQTDVGDFADGYSSVFEDMTQCIIPLANRTTGVSMDGRKISNIIIGELTFINDATYPSSGIEKLSVIGVDYHIRNTCFGSKEQYIQ